MNILRTEIDRKEVIDFYLRTDDVKKGTTTSADFGSLNWNDPNSLDVWLHKHGYKCGVMPGFKKWVYAQLSKEDLMDTAVENRIFPDKSQRLGDLLSTQEFQQWLPNTESHPIWYEPLSRGEFSKDFDIILRPAIAREGSKYYVEDGSGRSICYLRAIYNFNLVSEMCGYLGIEPDPRSNFMRQRFPELLTDESKLRDNTKK